MDADNKQKDGRKRARAGYYLDQVPSVHCLMCDQPIGKGPFREVRILARFGQMFFKHVKCPDGKKNDATNP